ncbi:hypothetical protein BGX29_004834 [Mortierella sp. GBA35]|nr:hypothetical protein BGX23_002327 [Mortierella sp. AD031]KAF9107775.1 hypothetical protein BGX29_004834 [Mortierella sp. GBA35]KAG0219317.1 hypothetical protein BGX33_003592 [Mortierella sp. NVP41]
MFTRLVKRASVPAQLLRNNNNSTTFRNQRHLRNNVNFVSFNSIRHQSSSSSRDNDNNNNQEDIEPITSNDVPINASLELHRVDLAHGSFFALHRPLLGIANGPMFANHHNNHLSEEDYEGKSPFYSMPFSTLYIYPVDDLANYFSTLHPYSPPSPLSQSALVTPTATAWASLAPSLPDADLAVEEFLQLVTDKQALRDQEDNSNQSASSSSPTATGATSGSMDVDGPITTKSILDPSMLDESNVMHMTSVLRKRRIKMRKHKYKKLRKRTRALRKKLGK